MNETSQDGISNSKRRVVWNMRTRLIAALASIVVLAIAVPVVSVIIRTDKTTSLAYSEPITHVDITTNGGIELQPSENATVGVRHKQSYIGRAPSIKAEVEGSTLTLSASCKGIRLGGCSTNFTLDLPTEVSVTAKTAVGAVEVGKTKGAVVIETKSGKVDVDGAFGRLQITTTTGAVDANNLSSLETTTRSRDGDVKLAFSVAPTNAEARSDNGDVTILMPKRSSQFDVTAESPQGKVSIDVETDRQSPFKIRATSGTGEVKVAKQ